MFKESIIGKFFLKLLMILKTFSESFTYKVMHNIRKSISDCYDKSNIARFLRWDDKINTYEEKSKVIGFFDKINGIILNFFKKIYQNIKEFNKGSLNNRAYRALNKNSKLRYLNIFGILTIFMVIVPGHMWNNMYGVLFALLLFVLYILVLFSGRNFSYKLSGIDIFMIIFMFMTVMGVAVSKSVGESIRVFIFFATSFIFMVCISGSINSKEDIERIVGFLICGLLLTSFYCIYQGIKGVEVDLSFVDTATNEGMPGRAYGTFENPNNFAEYIVMLMPFMAAFALTRNKTSKKIIWLLCLLIPFGALLYTYSRSCWVSFAIMAFVFIAFYNYKLIPLMILLGVICIPFLPQSILNRILTIGNMSDTSNSYRLLIWDGVLKMLKENWFTGIGLGPGPFTKTYPSFAHPNAMLAFHSHMLFMQVLVEMGIVAFLSFGIYWVATLKRLVTRLSKRKPSPFMKAYICAALSSFTGIIFVCGVEYVWYYPRVMFMFFIMLGIISAIIKIARKEEIVKE